jgi:hypothetical protein
MSRNSKYEERKKQQGLAKVTLWLPKRTIADFKQMAEFCIENRDCFPYMARSEKTGQMRKAEL